MSMTPPNGDPVAGRAAPRRTRWTVVEDLPHAVAVARQHSDILVVDIENTLVGYGSSPSERLEAIHWAIAEVEAAGGITRLLFASNGRFDLAPVAHATLTVQALGRARKPHVYLPPLRHLRSSLAGACVYGDQPLTDGLLAHRLRGIWLQPSGADMPTTPEPWWPRLMRRTGELVCIGRFDRV